jgi:hypothetical protein
MEKTMRKKRNELLAQKVIKGLASRNITGYYAATAEEAPWIPETHNYGIGYLPISGVAISGVTPRSR